MTGNLHNTTIRMFQQNIHNCIMIFNSILLFTYHIKGITVTFKFATSDIVDNFQQFFPYSDVYNNYSINCLNIHLNALNNNDWTLQDQTTLLRRYVACVRTDQPMYLPMCICLFACLFCFHVFLYFRKIGIIYVYRVNSTFLMFIYLMACVRLYICTFCIKRK